MGSSDHAAGGCGFLIVVAFLVVIVFMYFKEKSETEKAKEAESLIQTRIGMRSDDKDLICQGHDEQQLIFMRRDTIQHFKKGVRVLEVRPAKHEHFGYTHVSRSWTSVAICESDSDPSKRVVVEIDSKTPVMEGELWSIILDEYGNYQLEKILRPQSDLPAEASQ